MSTAFCALSQNSGVVRNVAPSFSAIAALTEVPAVHDPVDHLDVAAEMAGKLLLRHTERQ